MRVKSLRTICIWRRKRPKAGLRKARQLRAEETRKFQKQVGRIENMKYELEEDSASPAPREGSCI